jgi:simple sugar transport system permease protein
MDIGLLVTYLLRDALWLMTPLFYAAIGEFIVEKAGVLNLGIEGMMLISAFVAFAIGFLFENPYIALLIGCLAGILVNLLFYILFQLIGVDQSLAGLSITIFGSGVTFFAFRAMIGYSTSASPPVVKNIISDLPLPILSRLPILGSILFDQNPFVYLSFLLLFLFYVVEKSDIGLKIRTIGEDPSIADFIGIDVYKFRLICVIVQGFLSGVAGSMLTISIYNTFLDNITAGLGFIAITMVILGGWNPIRIFYSSFLFGLIYALQFRVQMYGASWLPYQFALSLPYIVTIILLAVFGRKYRPPTSLGKPYKRIR